MKLKIYGRVQGVFFRENARRLAEKLNLMGYVKNATDGTVETSVEGDEKNIEQYILWCKRGPELAEVEKVEKVEVESGKFNDFQVE